MLLNNNTLLFLLYLQGQYRQKRKAINMPGNTGQ